MLACRLGGPRLYETSASRVYLVRRDGGALPPEQRDALLQALRVASAGGPVAVLLDLGPDPALDASATAWWLRVLQDREADVAVLAVVSAARSVRLATLGFSALVSLRHLPVEVRALPDGEAAIGWASGALARAAAARRRASQAEPERREPR